MKKFKALRFFFLFKKIHHIFIYVHMLCHVYDCQARPETEVRPLEAVLQETVSWLKSVLGTKLKSSGGAASGLNC